LCRVSIRRAHRHRYYPYTRTHAQVHALRLSFRSSATLAKNTERTVQRAREAPGDSHGDALNLSLIYYHRVERGGEPGEGGGGRENDRENVAEEVAPSSTTSAPPSLLPSSLSARVGPYGFSS
jgi:hypothetical protein